MLSSNRDSQLDMDSAIVHITGGGINYISIDCSTDVNKKNIQC
jgi:hypothetical protein